MSVTLPQLSVRLLVKVRQKRHKTVSTINIYIYDLHHRCHSYNPYFLKMIFSLHVSTTISIHSVIGLLSSISDTDQKRPCRPGSHSCNPDYINASNPHGDDWAKLSAGLSVSQCLL